MALNTAVTDTRWSPNFSQGRPAGAPTTIVIHHWGADGQTHDGVVNWLCNRRAQASAHYVASAGRVTQLVHDYDRAWHAGPGGNPRGIGIECRPECSDADFETVARLIAAIRAQHGNLPLRGHKDYMSTACPGRWYARLAELDARARAIAGQPTTAPAPAAPAPAPAVPGRIAEDSQAGPATIRLAQTLAGTPVDGVISGQSEWNRRYHHALYSIRYGRGGSALVGAIQRAVRVTDDGHLGPITIAAMQRALGVTPDSHFGPVTALAWQKRLNAGRLI